MEDAKTILKKHRISITRTRLAILDMLRQVHYPLPYNYFLNHSGLTFDRVTIFRTLKLFADKKIIYRVPSTDGLKKYAIKRNVAEIKVSFVCSKCQKIVPAKGIELPEMDFPDRWAPQKIKVLLEGLCETCSLKPYR